VMINGEPRPLDVPPMVYHGIVLVPVRVISEAMGAYVLWVPHRHVVVVRYIPLEPVPTPPPASPSPTPSPTPGPYSFIQAAVTHGNNYNEFSAGQFCPENYLASGAIVFKN